MRKAIVLVLLIVLGTMPLQTSAQLSVPSVDLSCTNLDSENRTGDAGRLAWIDTFAPQPLLPNGTVDPDANWLNYTVSCTLSNPNSYVERIQIQVSADGLVVAAPGSITLAPNGEESFNVTVRADRFMNPSIRTLTITAKVVEANGAPPPNIAESQVIGEIHLSTRYGPNGCATFAENGFRFWGTNLDLLVTMTIEHRLPWNRAGPEPNNWLEMNTENVTFRINWTAAPLHAANFYTLTMMGCYDDMPFHRVIDGFMAQTGDVKFGNSSDGNFNLQRAGMGGSDLPDLKEEFNSVPHERGTLSMARSSDPNSANSQFFICFKAASFLDRQYTVFGKVIEGMEFVDNIKKGDESQNGSVENPDKILSFKSL